MNKIVIGALVLIILIGGGYWYMQQTKSDAAMQTSTMGEYAYMCYN